MGELNGKIDTTLQKAVKQLEKELKAGITIEVPTAKELKEGEELILKGRGKVGDLEINIEKTIRRNLE